MKTAQFIVKEAAYEGTYRNPYKRGGRAMKWGPWKKRSSHDTLAEALAAAVEAVRLLPGRKALGGEQDSDWAVHRGRVEEAGNSPKRGSKTTRVIGQRIRLTSS
jgi:hypothetical protein